MSFADINGIKLCYEIYGRDNNIPIILIHGFGAKKEIWNSQVGALSKKFKVITFDIRGSGKSDRPNKPYTMEMFADDIKGLMDYLNIEKSHILGRSMGGMIAQNFVVKYPEKVNKLILVTTGPGGISGSAGLDIFKENQIEIGTINDFISKMPQSGDLITIELDNPGKDTLAKMRAIESALFVEERKNEKYKIYCLTEHPNIIINKLMGSIGDYIYNYKIHKATLNDYLELSKINENYVNIE